MSYRREREEFIARMTREGLPLHVTLLLLREATGLNRRAELLCSSEGADRDRVPCPEASWDARVWKDLGLKPRKAYGPCLCDFNGEHHDVPRIAIQDWRAEERIRKALPDGWTFQTAGDPREYVLRVIPPSYAERNKGRDQFNLDAIGVPSGPSGLRW